MSIHHLLVRVQMDIESLPRPPGVGCLHLRPEHILCSHFSTSESGAGLGREQGSAGELPVRGQMINVLGFVSHAVSVMGTQVYLYRGK